MAERTTFHSLEIFLNNQPTIKYVPPSAPEFHSFRNVWNSSHAGVPLAIVQPQSASDVAALIKFAKNRSLHFTLRSGGHNLQGRSVVDNALLIDLRALNTVTIAPDRQSATVGGGILQGDLATKLWEAGLATPTGAVPSVGYAGWATYGGYGPFSSHWGLGVDQVIGATIVNADGEIETAEEELLQGIRGAGGLYGAIVDLTIKVYPLTGILAGPIIFDSSDIAKTFVDFNIAYNALLATEGLPAQATVQRVVFNTPRGRVFAITFVWSGSAAESEEGKRWSAKIAALVPCQMNAVVPTTIPKWFASNGAHIPTSVYGSSRTYNLASISNATAEAIGRNLALLPSDPAAMFTVHQLRGPSVDGTLTKPLSVFATREPHYMLEILGYATSGVDQGASEAWAAQMAAEIELAGQGDILPTAYVSLYGPGPTESPDKVLEKVYGSKAEVVRLLKARVDPENTFRLAVPTLD
ncbi:FAD-binding domain-containing protein [Aspergillus pseudoustus]|uniref:FAD-binding domain-containing protein n=1 Tax=Aspergillus pseudoustus TaxID=1810923 RepID=A0ABR4JS91_9EURO